LNGREHSVKNDVVYNDIRETSSRIVAITDSTTLVAGVPVFTTHATQPGLGQYVLNDIRYVRITNLDDTNGVVVSHTIAGPTTITFPLEAGGSIAFTSLTAALTINVIGHSADLVDVEVFVASV
jgi:hypothetical protein